MCGPVVETHTIYHPFGASLICLIQQVSLSLFETIDIDKILKMFGLETRLNIVFFSQGLPVVSHLEPGYLWRSGWQYVWHHLVLFYAGGADTNLPQNSSMVCSALISLIPSRVTGEDHPISVSVTGWTSLLHFFLLYRSSFYSDVCTVLRYDLIGQFRSTSWCETQAWSPTSYGSSTQSPDRKRGKLLLWYLWRNAIWRHAL